MENWFDSVKIIDDFFVEIGFSLNHSDAVYLPSAEKGFITSSEAEKNIDGLISYYKDVLLFCENNELDFKQSRQYYNLSLVIFNNDHSLYIIIPWANSLIEIERILHSIANPSPDRQIYWDKTYVSLFEMHIHQGLLCIRDKDPDGEEIFAMAKFPLLNVWSSFEIALKRIKNIIVTVSSVLHDNPWKDERI